MVPRKLSRVDDNPTSLISVRGRAWLAMAMLLASAVCVAVAPLYMPDTYRVSEHAVSASAGQGIENAWIARTGFLLLALAVLTLASVPDNVWGRAGRWTHGTYGVLMLGAATFAHMPWEDVPFVEFEDFLHSVAASAMGFAFTLGVLILVFRRPPHEVGSRVFDWCAIVAAVVIPLVMFNFESWAGYTQRIMFAIAYVWYGVEAFRMSQDEPKDVSPSVEAPTAITV